MSDYAKFLENKSQIGDNSGFKPIWTPDFLYDFQKYTVERSIRKGRGAVFADCGLGKTAIELVFAENVVRKTNRPFLILTPLAVSHQTVAEAGKFDIEAKRSSDGKAHPGINVTNYERLHLFDPNDFAGVACDESSILKSFDGAYKAQVTEFMRKIQYRLLCTATAAPNDYIELGTSSEALGYLGYMDMLNRFFKNDQNNSATGRLYGDKVKWRFRGHAEIPFWRWVCSWALAIRKPSDIGFKDDRFILPPISEQEHLVESQKVQDGFLFNIPVSGLYEQRQERRRTIDERCEKAAALINGTGKPSVMWCHLNDEGDLLEKLIPDCQQISGDDPDDEKEEKFMAFVDGKIRVLVTKPKIGAWGLNFQHCAHTVLFPSHSFEQYYQSVRRFWRFGQKNPVKVDIVTTEGERDVLRNLKRKAAAADRMFDNLIAEMNRAVKIDSSVTFNKKEIIPQWL